MKKYVYLVTVVLLILYPLNASQLLDENSLTKVATGFQFTEGPCWFNDGYLLFSDISGNSIYKWTAESGVELFLSPSGNSNGLAEDNQGRLLLAKHGDRCLSRIEPDSSETIIAAHYDSKKLNSPNDIAIKSNGTIYFTDPPYGIKNNDKELNFNGVFVVIPGEDPRLIDDSLERPNGIAFSPDETILYVADTENKIIVSYTVDPNDSVYNKNTFIQLEESCEPDGIKIDPDGNLYIACSYAGIWIYSKTAELLQTIPIPERTQNLAWGGSDKQTLFITAGTSVYKMEKVESISNPEMVLIPGEEFEMGDHHDLGGAEHRNDEVPVHSVYIDSFLLGKYEVTNEQYCEYLNSAYSKNIIEVKNGYVYELNGNEIFSETYPEIEYSQILWNGNEFSVRNNHEYHPVIGIRWLGSIAYCNWLSFENNYDQCYDLTTGICDFSKDGFRLPTEAEWEYAGRGQKYDPYCIFPWGDDENESGNRANWPDSKDPFESGAYPLTTPVGFYDGNNHLKFDFDWPGEMENYQTVDG